MSRSPPLRFVVLILAGWTGIRAAWLAPGWWTPPVGPGNRAPRAEAPVHPPAAIPRETRSASLPARAGPGSPIPRGAAPPPGRPPAAIRHVGGEPRPPLPEGPFWSLSPSAARSSRPGSPPLPRAAGKPPAGRRWSLAAWSFLRDGDSAPLASGGLLGGSQAGLRLAYRLNRGRGRPLAATVRLASPLRRPGAAEAALGLDWRPSRRVPVHLVAERRQGLGRDGRSAFALTAYGGVAESPIGRLQIDAYAQAGVVGARSLDLFGDGAIRLSLPLAGRTRLGLGAWAAAQPGLARLDVGPQASLRLPLGGRSVTVAADWRRRLAGNARPGSGPTLTLSTDF